MYLDHLFSPFPSTKPPQPRNYGFGLYFVSFQGCDMLSFFPMWWEWCLTFAHRSHARTLPHGASSDDAMCACAFHNSRCGRDGWTPGPETGVPPIPTISLIHDVGRDPPPAMCTLAGIGRWLFALDSITMRWFLCLIQRLQVCRELPRTTHVRTHVLTHMLTYRLMPLFSPMYLSRQHVTYTHTFMLSFTLLCLQSQRIDSPLLDVPISTYD